MILMIIIGIIFAIIYIIYEIVFNKLFLKNMDKRHKLIVEKIEEFKELKKEYNYKNVPIRLFLSGSISSNPDYKDDFNNAETILRNKGYNVFNCTHMGLEVYNNDVNSWRKCMCETIPAMLKCDGIAVLENSENSKGVKAEKQIAELLQIPLMSIEEWIKFKDENNE